MTDEEIIRDAADKRRWDSPTEHMLAQRVAQLVGERDRLRAAIVTHRSQKADDRCIEDDDRLYAVLGDGVPCDRRVGDKLAMLRNCARFIDRRCEGGRWPSYADLEAVSDKLRAALAQANAALLAWEKWEGDIIADSGCWAPGGTAEFPTITGPHYDALVPGLQEHRNRAKKAATEALGESGGTDLPVALRNDQISETDIRVLAQKAQEMISNGTMPPAPAGEVRDGRRERR